MRIVENNISNQELEQMVNKAFGSLVKAVVDIEKELMAVDAELHSDEEELLLENGSLQRNLWGINIHPDKVGTDNWIEFDSMINMRPSQGNRSRGIENEEIRKKIISIVAKRIKR